MAFRTMWAEGKHHTSPNSGRPEAAMAGAIDVWLAGPRHYGNQVRHALKFNASGRDADRRAIDNCLGVMRVVLFTVVVRLGIGLIGQWLILGQ